MLTLLLKTFQSGRTFNFYYADLYADLTEYGGTAEGDIIFVAETKKLCVTTGVSTWDSIPYTGESQVSEHTHPQSEIINLVTDLANKVASNDSRLSDARTPLTHGHGQSDITGLVTDLSNKCASNDSRLSDARTPTSHTHIQSEVTGLVTDLAAKCASNDSRLSDARTPTTHSHPQSEVTNLVTDLSNKCASNDSRLSDARTPTSHTHPQSEITNLVTDLSGKAATSHTHNATDINAGTVATIRLGSGTANSSTYLRGDQTWATPASGGGPATVKSTADQTKTDATLINVTNNSFSVTSGVYYHFRFMVPHRSTVATVGLKLGLTFPAVTVFACFLQSNLAVAGVGGGSQGFITASGGSFIVTAIPAINTDYLAVVDGVILPSANGTLQLQFAAETTGATVTCRNGAMGFLYTIQRVIWKKKAISS